MSSAKEHHLEVRGQLMHGTDHQRRLADAAHAQHAHHPAALLDHPLGEESQFPLAPVEGRHGERVAPIHPWPPRRRRSEDVVNATGLLDRQGRQER